MAPQLKNQFMIYFLCSNLLALGCIYHAFDTRPTFLAACIFLSGGLNVIIIANWLILLTIVTGKLIQLILFGELRLIEYEHIRERIGFAIGSAIFSMATFRVDNILMTGSFALFSIILRLFHWILFDRMEALFQVNDEDLLYDLKRILANRIIPVIGLFLYLDIKFISYCIKRSYIQSTDIYISYEFEVGILFLEILFGVFKILINIYEIIYLKLNSDEESFEKKSFYIQIVELIHSFAKAVVHLFALYIFLDPYHFPIPVLQNSFMSCMAFYKKLKDFVLFIQNAKKLDYYLSNAIEEDLEGSNSLCIICREDMTTKDIKYDHRLFPKKLNCGHIIHLGCLKSWLEISQLCPMCRGNVFDTESNNNNYNSSNNNNNNNNDNDDNDNDNDNNNNSNNVETVNAENIPTTSSNFPTNTTTEPSPISNFNNETNTLTLPKDSIIPEDWSFFPIRPVSNDVYKVKIGNEWIDLQVESVGKSKGKEKIEDYEEESDYKLIIEKLSDRISSLEKEIKELKKGN